MRVLLVEDNPDALILYKRILLQAKIMVDATESGEEGNELAQLYDYDLILLDLGLPDLSGKEIIRNLRLAKISTPILILSGAADMETKLTSFGLGADDYLTKPFQKGELIARINSIVRRTRGHARSTIEIGLLAVDTEKKSVRVKGETVNLTRKEYQILEVLLFRRGRVISKDVLLDYLYGGIDEPSIRIIDVFMCKLRKKLRTATGGERFIETIHGQGYIIYEPQVLIVGQAPGLVA